MKRLYTACLLVLILWVFTHFNLWLWVFGFLVVTGFILWIVMMSATKGLE